MKVETLNIAVSVNISFLGTMLIQQIKRNKKTVYYINYGVILGFPALGKVVTTQVKK